MPSATDNRLLRRVSIGTRLTLVFAMLLSVLVVQSLSSLWAGRASEAAVRHVTEELQVQMQAVRQARDLAKEHALVMNQYLLLLEFPQADLFRDSARKATAAADTAAQALSERAAGSELQAPVQAALSQRAKLMELQVRVEKKIAEQKNEEAVGLWVRDSSRLIGEQDKALLALVQQLDQAEGAATTRMQAKLRHGAWLDTALLALSLLFTLAAGWALRRSITQPLAQAVQASEALAAGDLSVAVAASGNDEPARLLRALAETRVQLAAALQRVADTAGSIRVASSQIAGGSADLSSRAEEQARSLQQTNRSMSEMTRSVLDSAEHARQADRAASASVQAAERSGQAVSEAVSTMADISASSRRIADIIGVIDGIAFQTNILALNAAVEAARAGEQGRGFAVVASEVRQLAQRSAQAASEIKALITASVERVESGASLIDGAGQQMGQAVTSVREVAALIRKMADSAQVQGQGISAVSERVSALDGSTQQNTALAGQSLQAAQALEGLAGDLHAALGRFKLEARPA
jgi:methyl-accepting chemotaxis protein